MYSVRRTAVLPAVGFPIRVSADHTPFSASSRLIAAVHALLRLLVPRHPPCALDILTVILIDLAVALPGLHPPTKPVVQGRGVPPLTPRATRKPEGFRSRWH